MAPADLAVLALLAIAALRGLFLGLVRELVSLASLVAACVAVRFGAAPGGAWLQEVVGADLEPLVAQVIAGVAIAVAVLVAGALLGRIGRMGARAVGLGWLDRGAGGILGAAEGALVAAALLMVTAVVVGRDHPFVAESRAFAALERAERVARERADELPPVAAPPERREL
jgi:membrane protein required for colicin V production